LLTILVLQSSANIVSLLPKTNYVGRAQTVGGYCQKAFIDKSLHYKIKEFGKLEKNFKVLFRFFDEKALKVYVTLC
jgi:hypothetical protein